MFTGSLKSSKHLIPNNSATLCNSGNFLQLPKKAAKSGSFDPLFAAFHIFHIFLMEFALRLFWLFVSGTKPALRFSAAD